MGSAHDLILDCMASTHLDKEKMVQIPGLPT